MASPLRRVSDLPALVPRHERRRKSDLQGILARLDHLSWLGVDAVWLGPVQPSPMDDFGYDISDYEDVDPVFGTLDDLQRLTDELHRRDIRLILDFVPNHTSSERPWFIESRSSRTNAKSDWYIWADAAPDGGPPTNWLSRFGGSAWGWEPRRSWVPTKYPRGARGRLTAQSGISSMLRGSTRGCAFMA